MTEPIVVQCPHCQAKFRLKSRAAVGKRLPCPKCKTPFVVTETGRPTAKAATPAPPAATGSPRPPSASVARKHKAAPARAKAPRCRRKLGVILVGAGILAAAAAVVVGIYLIGGSSEPKKGPTTTQSAPVPTPLAPAPKKNPEQAKPTGADTKPTQPTAPTKKAESPAHPAVTTDQPVPSADVSPAMPTASVPASSWNQFHGPHRDNRSSESGLLDRWPPEGPKLLWTASGIGEGYSTVSLAHGLVYTMGNVGEDEMIFALDLATGKQRWATRNAAAYSQDRGNGPRATPTIDGGTLYAMGGAGNLSRVDAKSGKVAWQKDVLKELGAKNLSWGISESVLIDGERLICTPGGKQATMAAIDKDTGAVLWKAQAPGNPKAAYASPIVIDVGGVRQYVNFTHNSVIGVRASDGQFLWEDRSSANGVANCSTALFHEGHVFSASGYGTGGALLKLQSQGDTTQASLVYKTKDMKNHHGGMAIVDGFLYGSNDPGILTCLELKTGRAMWKERSVGKGSVTYADGHLYLRSEKGPVALVEATPRGYNEKGRFDQPQRSDRPSWPHPVVAEGKLFLRDQDKLFCYDLRKS